MSGIQFASEEEARIWAMAWTALSTRTYYGTADSNRGADSMLESWRERNATRDGALRGYRGTSPSGTSPSGAIR